MAKIFSILTLIIAGVAIYLALEGDRRVKEMHATGVKTVGILKQTEARWQKTEATLKTTEENLTKTTAELEGKKAELATTKENLDKATGELATTKKALDDKTAELTGIMKQLDEVIPGGIGDISKLKENITMLTDKTKSQEAQIVELTKTKANLESNVAELQGTKKQQDEKIVDQGNKIDKYVKNIMVKGIRGRVDAVNAGWGFCVVSIGDKQGAAANKILIVVRDGRAIGKVKITNVESTQSVADILPNSFIKGTFVAPGDVVIYTGEDKANVEDPAAAGNAVPLPALPAH
jgi:hypothetical protein